MTNKEYFQIYGPDIEIEERREKARQAAEVQRWVRAQTDALDQACGKVIQCTETLAPGDKELCALARKAALFLFSIGLPANCLNVTYGGGGGTYINEYRFYPYRELLLALGAEKGRVLCYAEGVLSEEACGLFWQRLIDVLPPYTGMTTPKLNGLFSALDECHFIAAGAKGSSWWNDLKNTFMPHWAWHTVYHPDRAAAEAAVRRWDFSDYPGDDACRDFLIVSFPELEGLWTPSKLKFMDEGDLLFQIWEELGDPALALRMFRLRWIRRRNT